MLTSERLAELRRDLLFTVELRDRRLELRTTWGLFSPRAIDEGTALLIRHLDVPPGSHCLDLGCGYGVIGLVMAALDRAGEVLMVDKDFVAVDYANRNAQANGLTHARAQLSNGFAQIDPALRFDRIASNVPAKVGRELMALLLHDAHDRLRPGGCIDLVTINGLRQYMKRGLTEVFGNYEKIKQGPHYTLCRAVRD